MTPSFLAPHANDTQRSVFDLEQEALTVSWMVLAGVPPQYHRISSLGSMVLQRAKCMVWADVKHISAYSYVLLLCSGGVRSKGEGHWSLCDLHTAHTVLLCGGLGVLLAIYDLGARLQVRRQLLGADVRNGDLCIVPRLLLGVS